MGFFSELKEDLSQAVNELMPEEVIKEELLPEEQAVDQVEETKEEGSYEKALDVTDKDDLAKLNEMLQRVDSIEVPMDSSMDPRIQRCFIFGIISNRHGIIRKKTPKLWSPLTPCLRYRSALQRLCSKVLPGIRKSLFPKRIVAGIKAAFPFLHIFNYGS